MLTPQGLGVLFGPPEQGCVLRKRLRASGLVYGIHLEMMFRGTEFPGVQGTARQPSPHLKSAYRDSVFPTSRRMAWPAAKGGRLSSAFINMKNSSESLSAINYLMPHVTSVFTLSIINSCLLNTDV